MDRDILIEHISGFVSIEEGLYTFGCSYESLGRCVLRWLSPDESDMLQLQFFPAGEIDESSLGWNGTPGDCDGGFASAGTYFFEPVEIVTFEEFVCDEITIRFDDAPFGGVYDATLLL